MDDYRKALDYFLQSLILYRAKDQRHTQTFLLKVIGWTYANLGELAPAIVITTRNFSFGAQLASTLGKPAPFMILRTLSAGVTLFRSARKQIEAALDIIESLRTQIANQQSRTSYFTEAQQYYEFYVSLLMQLNAQNPSQGFDAMALQGD